MSDINKPGGPEIPDDNERSPDPAAEFINSLTAEQRARLIQLLGNSAASSAEPGKKAERTFSNPDEKMDDALAGDQQKIIQSLNDALAQGENNADTRLLFRELVLESHRRLRKAAREAGKPSTSEFSMNVGGKEIDLYEFSSPGISNLDMLLTELHSVNKAAHAEAVSHARGEVEKIKNAAMATSKKSQADSTDNNDSTGGGGKEPPKSDPATTAGQSDDEPFLKKRFLRWPWKRKNKAGESSETGRTSPPIKVTPLTGTGFDTPPPPVPPAPRARATGEPDDASKPVIKTDDVSDPEVKPDDGKSGRNSWPRGIAAASLAPFVFLGRKGAAGGRFLLWDGPIKGKGSPVYLINIPSKIVQATGRSAGRGWQLLKGRKRNIALGAVAGSVVPGPGTIVGAISGAFWPKWNEKSLSSDKK